MRRLRVGVGCAAFVALVIVACGRVGTGEGLGDGGGAGDGASDAPSFGLDAPYLHPHDGGPTGTYHDASPPDAGPPPILACLDAGLACPLPASECIDTRWLRYYTGGSCDEEAGTCAFAVETLDCYTANTNSCYKGGCVGLVGR